MAHHEAIASCETKVLDDMHLGDNARFDSIVIKVQDGEPNALGEAAFYEVTGNVNGTAFDCSTDGTVGQPSGQWTPSDLSAGDLPGY